MPIYEYRCEDCGSKFEKLVRRPEDQSEIACPSCGRTRLKQEFSVFAPHASSGGSKPAATPPCRSGGGCNPGMCGMNFN